MHSVYLDHNATTNIYPEVISAMVEVMQNPANSSSIHSFGRDARARLQSARFEVAEFAGAPDNDYRVIFTSSGTESNNLVFSGVKNRRLVISSVEHASVIGAAEGAEVISVDENGVVDLDLLEKILLGSSDKALVSVMLANNETGVIQPIRKIADLTKEYGAILHVDCAQGFGKVKVDAVAMGADLITLSAHKFGGPQGAAALIARRNVELAPQIKGGGQEQGYRAGTENVAAIFGMGVAIGLAKESMHNISRIEELRDYLENSVKSISSDAIIFGEKAKSRLPNTSYIATPDISSQTQLIHFDMDRIAVSSGSACSSGKIGKSHVLSAMGIEDMLADCAIRVSLGHSNTKEDIDAFINSWRSLVERLSLKKVA